jgi:hypothetical protein
MSKESGYGAHKSGGLQSKYLHLCSCVCLDKSIPLKIALSLQELV